MTLGSVSSLGVGSGFELQQMLDDLRAADETSINIKESEKTRLTEQIVEFNSLNAKILQMKSDALSLSLESNFMDRTATIDEEVALATVQTGSTISSYSLDIDRLASKSAWQADTGAAGSSAVMYAEPTTSYTTFTEATVGVDTALSFTVEHEDGQQTISLTIAANSSIQDIVDAINADSENINGDSTYVTATAATSDDGSYVKLSSTTKDTTENSQILVTEGPAFITPDLNFSYQVGAGNDPVYVVVPPGASYDSVVTLINDDANNSGMTAAMVDTGVGATPWKLTFTADATGEDSRISISANLTMTEIQGAVAESLNAAFSIDGVDYQRQSNNDIDDVIQSVSLTLKKVDSTQVSISASTEAMKEKIIDLIDTYNEINADIDLKTAYATDVNDAGGILSNIQSLKSLDSILFDLLGTIVDTGTSITSLADLGMETNQDGTITLDQSVLNEAFASSLDDVTALFIGDSDRGIEGLGDTLNVKLRSMTNSSTGIVNAEKSTMQEKIDTLTDSIETATQRLDRKYDQMARQFIQLDSFIGRMNSQMNYLGSMLDAFNDTNKTD
ncbi:MAG: flagellar filament capping protein FliD [Desulfobacteraceae bacterium]|nr:flagellar filament capping protein FliD [Desulfobacteraceae bacterium]